MKETQKIIKYGAIAFAIFLIICIFSGIFGALSGLSYVFDDNEAIGEVKTEEFDSEVSVLDIKIAAASIEIKDGKELSVETNNKYISSKQNGNKLVVKERKHNFINNNNSKVTIYIPSDTNFERVNLEAGAGTLSIKTLTTNEIDLEFGAGKIDINNLIVESNADIEGGAGEVNINNAIINNMDLDAGVGEFNIRGVFTGRTDINAGVGELNIDIMDNEDNYRLSLEKGIGSIKVNGQTKKSGTYGKGTNTFEVEGGVGSINIKFKK